MNAHLKVKVNYWGQAFKKNQSFAGGGGGGFISVW